MIRITLFIFTLLCAGACSTNLAVVHEVSQPSPVDTPKFIAFSNELVLNLPYKETNSYHGFVSFIVDESGKIANPVVTQTMDDLMKYQIIKSLNYLQFTLPTQETKPITIEMTIPVIFQGDHRLPNLSDYLDQIPILLGSIENLVNQIQYPERARRASLEGRVTVAFIIDQRGKVRLPTITHSLGAGCDEEVLRAIEHLQFSPGQIRGHPVNVITSLTFVFELT